MPELHAKIGPSSFSRVKLCPASLRFAARFPNTSNAAADEGTACHEVVEHMLNGALIEPGWTAENGIAITPELYGYCEEAFDYVAELGLIRIMTEIKVPVGVSLGLNDPDMMWGTSDVVGLDVDGRVHVIDFKFGRVAVYARSPTGKLNDQGMCYLSGALQALDERGVDYDRNEFVITIVQPKAGGVKSTTVSAEELDTFRKAAREAVGLALSADAPFHPGEDQCRFCPASGACQAQVDDDFEDLDEIGLQDVDDLSDADLGSWLDKIGRLKATLTAMQTQALARIAVGRKIPGWVTEQGNGRAKWIDEEAVVAEIEAAGLDLDTYAPRKPTTQTALKAKTALGKAVVETLITRPPGEVKLVREEDAKNPLGSEFEKLD